MVDRTISGGARSYFSEIGHCTFGGLIFISFQLGRTYTVAAALAADHRCKGW